MSQCLDIVDKFLECGKDTSYDVVHQLTVLDLNDVDTNKNHGQMSAVIRYKTRYIVAGKGPFILSFVLGNDINLRSVVGLPTLLVMSAEINFVKGLLSFIELNRSFPIELQPPGQMLPKGASLNHYSSTIPSTVYTNLTHTNSMLHYISAEGIPQPVCSSTPSDNILVTDYFYHNTVTRELSYVPSNSSSTFT